MNAVSDLVFIPSNLEINCQKHMKILYSCWLPLTSTGMEDSWFLVVTTQGSKLTRSKLELCSCQRQCYPLLQWVDDISCGGRRHFPLISNARLKTTLRSCTVSRLIKVILRRWPGRPSTLLRSVTWKWHRVLKTAMKGFALTTGSPIACSEGTWERDHGYHLRIIFEYY